MSDADALDLALRQIEFARGYTHSLLADFGPEDWFRMPEGLTHAAWQAGHLAMAQYGLCLFRQRGRRPEDAELMSGAFRKQFAKGSRPEPDPARCPPPAEILATLERVHRQALAELRALDPAVLREPVDEPFAAEPTKLGALLFCSHHEMLHAGQLGLLRRLLGKPPVR